MSYEVRLYNKARTVRKPLTEADCGAASFTTEPNGGWSDFTLPVSPDKIGLATYGDCVELVYADKVVYRGYVGDLDFYDDDLGSGKVGGYGRSFDLTQIFLEGYLQYPTKQDVGTIAVDIFEAAAIAHPDIYIYVEGIGVTIDYLDINGKTVKQALDALLEYCRADAVWGFDVEPVTGRDRFYFVRSGVEKLTVEVPGPHAGQRSVKSTDSDVKNKVMLKGGPPEWPQLMPNPSMEILRRIKDLDYSVSSNLVLDGTFQNNLDLSPNWTLHNGASVKTNGQGDPDALYGDRVVELDQLTEYVEQVRVVDVAPSRQYEVGIWYRPEFDADASMPPEMRITLDFQNALGDTGIGGIWTVTADRQTWQVERHVVTSPAAIDGCTGFRLRFEAVGGVLGPQHGLVIDGAYLTDATEMFVEGWRLYDFGDSEILEEHAIYGAGVGKHARTANKLKFTAFDENDRDIQFAYARQGDGRDLSKTGYTAQVVGGKQYRFSVWERYNADWARPKQIFEIRWRRQDGTIARHDKQVMNPLFDDTFVEWQELEYTFPAAPNDAVLAEPWITFRGDGELELDCISLRDFEDPFIGVFMDAGNLYYTATVLDLLGEDEDGHDSIDVYGERAVSPSVSTVINIEQARSWILAYLRVYALVSKEPPLALLDWTNPLKCGIMVRVVGGHASLYPANERIVRINTTLDDRGKEDALEVGRQVPTEEELYAKLVIDNQASIQAVGASVSSPSASVGGVGGGPGPTVANASEAIIGVTRLSIAPTDPAEPIAVGVNDPVLTAPRTPLSQWFPVTAGSPPELVYIDGTDEVVYVQVFGYEG